MGLPALKSEPVVLSEIIGALLSKHQDSVLAAQELQAMAEADSALYRAIVGARFWGICHDAVSGRMRKWRHNVFVIAAPGSATARLAPLAALTEATSNALIDTYTLPSGKVIGNASKEEVLAGAAAYEIQRNSLEVKRRFLAKVADAMPNHGTVRDHLTEDRLVALRDEARQMREAA